MPGAVKFGDEFLVNTITTGSQFGPTVTGLANGRFVASWVDLSMSPDDPSEGAIRAQLFNADGSKSGDEFLVNTTINFSQYDPVVTALDDGRFVIAWSDGSGATGDTSGWAVRGQVFEAGGARSGNEFIIPRSTGNDQLDVSLASLPQGFVAVWQDNSQTGEDKSDAAVRGQMFGANGAPLGEEFLVNMTTGDAQVQPVVARLANGGFAVAWTDLNQMDDDGGTGIRARVFGADGRPASGELHVNSTTNGAQVEPAITGLADGRFIVTWTDDGEVARENGGTVVRGQIYAADGTPIGGEFDLPGTRGSAQFTPEITALADGGFVASWVDVHDFGETGERLLNVQVFKADGTRSGAEIVVPATSDFGLTNHAVTALADGRFVVTWDGGNPIGPDTEGAVVHAQIFDPRDKAVYLGGSWGADDLIGTGFSDTLGGSIGDDRLDGAGGDDMFVGGEGNDNLFGGAGTDMAVFTGKRADYDVGRSSNGDIYIGDVRDGHPDGYDFARGVELFRFTDGTFTAAQLFAEPNHAPVVAHRIPDCVSPADGRWTFRVPGNAFADADGDRLTFKASLASGKPLPDWLHFDGAARTFSGKPPKDWSGAIDLKVTASDGGQAVSDTFRLTIRELEDEPGVVIRGTGKADRVNAEHTVKGQSFPTGGDDLLRGRGGADRLSGLDGDDMLRGGKGGDALKGGGGDDVLAGRWGKNVLTGGSGSDNFVFRAKFGDGGAYGKKTGEGGHKSFAEITDFASGTDTISLAEKVFRGLEPGALDAAAFHAGRGVKAGRDEDDRIIHDTKSGKLYFDADGAGGKDAVLFAKVARGVDLDHGDFLVI
jgi:hypothetical protein